MAEFEEPKGDPVILPQNYKRPDEQGLLQIKNQIDEGARAEWREEYGEIHEQYVIQKTRVYIDKCGDVVLVLPLYHPPGAPSPSHYHGRNALTPIPKPGLPPADHFHCNLAQSIRTEAMRRAANIERDFDDQLSLLFSNAVARGADPERKKLGNTPASLYGNRKQILCQASRVFTNRVKSMWDPQAFRYEMWGFEKIEVDIIRGIIFVRYIAGWWARDEKLLVARRTAAQEGEGGRTKASRPDVDTIHDDLDA